MVGRKYSEGQTIWAGKNTGVYGMFTDSEEQTLAVNVEYMVSIVYSYTKTDVLIISKKTTNNSTLSNCWFYQFKKRCHDENCQ